MRKMGKGRQFGGDIRDRVDGISRMEGVEVPTRVLFT